MYNYLNIIIRKVHSISCGLCNECWEVVYYHYLSKNIVSQRMNQLFCCNLLETHFCGKGVEWGRSFNYLKTFLTVRNKILFFLYDSVYTLFGNNNLVWKFQLLYVCLLAEVAVSLGIVSVCFCCFYHFGSFCKHFDVYNDDTLW